MDNKISSGAEALDHLLQGGYEKDVITTIYGPAGSGKTNLALLCAIQAVKEGKKVLFVDTEGGFSIERVKQLIPDHQKVLDNTLFLRPTTFEEQKNAFEKLRTLSNKGIGLIVIDGISMLYRLELGKNTDPNVSPIANRELALQIAYLTEIARSKSIPVIMTNQVYSSFDIKDKVNLVGGDIVLYGSKCLIELQKYHDNKRLAIIRKHRSLPESRSVEFEIVEQGLRWVDKEKKSENSSDNN